MRFVGRQNAVRTVSEWLRESEEVGPSKVRIASIYGPGGIGKTFLVSYCLQEARASLQDRYLQVRLSGQTPNLDLLDLWTSRWLADVSKGWGEVEAGTWPRLQALEKEKKTLRLQMESSIRRQSQEIPEMRGALEAICEVGLRPQEALRLRPYDLRLMEIRPEALEQAVQMVQNLAGWRRERQWLGSLRWGQGRRIVRNQLRLALEETLASALIADLRQALQKPTKKQASAAASSPKELLLILDDYESLHPVTGDFLVGSLLPGLEASGLPVLLLVIGRDSLLAAHPDWGQHFRPQMGDRLLELKPFERWEALEMMRSHGIHASETCEAIWQRTQGFPFLLDLESEDYRQGGPSALHLKLFVDRLTRWMTPIQRSWLLPLCFLDEINLETIPRVLPNADPSVVLHWFQTEPSIRDPVSPRWQILAFVRERVQMALRNDSPQTYQQWLTKSQSPPFSGSSGL